MHSPFKKICVFCGSNGGTRPIYKEVAQQLGLAMVAENISLVYGGAHIGLMGQVANTVLENGGEVIGIIPHGLVKREIAHKGVTELHIVDSMHERKAMMAKFADAFIMLPGGFGSLEEFFEIATWAQLGIHQKPFGILNADNYYDHLIRFLDHAVPEGFLAKSHRDMIVIESEPLKLLESLRVCQLPQEEKWVSKLSIKES